jgi:ketosteroid isomerase-like protein
VYAKAVKTGDVALFMTLWDANPVKSNQGKPMFIGMDAIQKARTASAQAGTFESFAIGITGTYVDETIGFAYGNYTYTLMPANGGKTVKFEGKYETIFRKQADGTWKIWCDASNSNVPPAQ